MDKKLTVSLGNGVTLHFFNHGMLGSMELVICTNKRKFSFCYDSYSLEYHTMYNYVYDTYGELFLSGVIMPTVRIIN